MLAVLWLAAGLSAVAFSLAMTVRTETERASTTLEGVRAYYLAAGAIDRALLYMLWGPQYPTPDGGSRYYSPWTTAMNLSFPDGETVVEVIPERSKLNINQARPEEIFRLLTALGVEPDRAREITEAIADWRNPRPEGEFGMFDRYYLSLTPSFRARHASFEETEELLLVKGMTPELFHGGYTRDSGGALTPHAGLKDCVSVWGSAGPVDVNTAPAAVLTAVGASPEQAAAILKARAVRPFRSPEQLQAAGLVAGPLALRLGIGGGSIYTLRATARLRLEGNRLSDLRRSVQATVKLVGYGGGEPFQILRWLDNAWVW